MKEIVVLGVIGSLGSGEMFVVVLKTQDIVVDAFDFRAAS